MILIQGAGITGLTLAGLLEKAGLEYQLIEKSPDLAPLGAGLILQRNALDILAGLTRGDINAVSTPIRRMLLGSAEIPDLQAMTLNDATRSRGIHRGDLQQFLLAQIDRSRLHLGVSITDWQQSSDQVEARLNSGAVLQGTRLIGADGIASAIRTRLHGSPRVRHSGQWCARTVVNGQPTGDDAQEIHAGRYRLGVVPLSNGRSYVFWVRSRHPGGRIPDQHIRSSFQTMGVVGEALADLIEPDQPWLQHTLTDIPVFWGRQHTALLGDAAHALTPNLGQGAALGIEDAWVAVAEITAGAADLAGALRRRRQARVQGVRRLSHLMGRVAHVEQPLLQRMRNYLLRTTDPERSQGLLERWLNQQL